MKNYEELTIELIDYYKNKYDGELIIKSIEYKTVYINGNHIKKLEHVYEIYVLLDLLTPNANSWNIPNFFKSKVSFENAIKMFKVAVNGYLEALLIEKEFVEISSEKRLLVDLLSKDINSLNEEDFDFMISHYLKIEEYLKVQKYENLKKKYYEK